MRVQGIFVLCGITIFVVSLVFSGILSFYYNLNPTFIVFFMLLDSVVVLVITTLFLRKYHDIVLTWVKKAVSGDYSLDDESMRDEDVAEIVGELKDKDTVNSKKITLEKSDLKSIIQSLNDVKSIYDHERGKSDDIRNDIKNIKAFIETNIRTFEKIKAIGLEIKNTSKNIDNSTQNVLKDAKKQSESASKGVKAIGHEIQSITELKESIISSTKIIEELVEMSKRIRAFVMTITEMTKKTNMLALNAGIEAARAGEAGKSFSVVAEEIKNLATNSNNSAEEITQILKEIQKRTDEVIDMIKMTEKIEDNIKTFYQTGDIFIGIVKDVKHVEKIIANISSFTDEHFTDSELMFKIISDFYKKTEDYNKLADRMSMEVDEMDRTGMNIYASIDSVIAGIQKLDNQG